MSMSKVNSATQATDYRFLNMFELDVTLKDGSPSKWLMASRARNAHQLEERLKERCGPDAVAIAGIYYDNGTYYMTLIRQYRYPIGGYLYELPAGLTESGESLEDTAKRELKEETGLELLVTEVTPPFFSSAGMTDESCTIVYGACLGEPSLKGQERAEDIEVIFADAEECKRILREENVCMRTAMVIRQFLMCKWTTATKEEE